MPSESELLALYLADRDIPCPSCGYNMRGSEKCVCPECGKALVLGVGLGDWMQNARAACFASLWCGVYALASTAMCVHMWWGTFTARAFASIPSWGWVNIGFGVCELGLAAYFLWLAVQIERVKSGGGRAAMHSRRLYWAVGGWHLVSLPMLLLGFG